MKKIRFALIGCGKIGWRHAGQIKRCGTLVAVCDNIQERADQFGVEFDTKAYYDIQVMLDGEQGLDVVAVCTPNGLHAAHSIQVLRAARHVLCEKPMAITIHDAEAMINEATKVNRKLFAIKQNRFNPPVAAVKKALEQGVFGTIYSFQINCFWNRNDAYYADSWRGTKSLDGGTLFTQFSHFVDLLYWMLGDVRKVYAITKNYSHQQIIEFEDTGVVLLEMDRGSIGTLNYTVNSFQKNMEGSITLFGQKGTVKIGGQYLNELEYQQIEDFVFTDIAPGNGPNNYGHYVGSMSNHDKVYDNVVDVLQNGNPISANSFEAKKTIEIITKIYQSAGNLNHE